MTKSFKLNISLICLQLIIIFSVSVDRRQIPSGSTQLRSISGQTPRARGYDNTQRTLQTSARQWNSRRIPANVRSNYGRALISKLPPLRRTVQTPVVRSKISKPSNRVGSSRTGIEAATKKPVKDRDYTFHVVLLADVLCRICDNLQGEWRNNCREQRCSRASTDNSWNLRLTRTEPLMSAVGFVVCVGDVTTSSYEELTGAFVEKLESLCMWQEMASFKTLLRENARQVGISLTKTLLTGYPMSLF